MLVIFNNNGPFQVHSNLLDCTKHTTETVGFNPSSKFSSIWIWGIVCCYIQETVTIKANNVIFWNYNCNTVHGAFVFRWASFDFMLKSTFISHLHYFCWLYYWLLIQGWWFLEGRFFWWGEGEVLMPPLALLFFTSLNQGPAVV